MTFKYGMAKNKYLEKNCKGVLPEITNEKAGDYWVYKTCKVRIKGAVKRAESCKCDNLLVSRILWHKRITPSKGYFDIWYSLETFRYNFFLKAYPAQFQWRLLIFIRKNLWSRVLETNEKQVPLKSYSLKVRIDSVNQILKLHKPAR